MAFSIQKLAERLRLESDKTTAFFEGVNEVQLSQVVYTEGAAWNARQVLVHLVQAEEDVARLIAAIVSGKRGVRDDFDLDRHNQKRVDELSELAFDALIEAFRKNRQKTIELVQGLEEEDLQKKGRHPYLGPASIEQIVKLMYRHTQLHQRDLRRAFAAESAS